MKDDLDLGGPRLPLYFLYVIALGILCTQGALIWLLINRQPETPATVSQPEPFILLNDGSLVYGGQIYRSGPAPSPVTQYQAPRPSATNLPVTVTPPQQQRKPAAPAHQSIVRAPATNRPTLAPAVPQEQPPESHSRAAVRHLIGYLEAGKYKAGAYQVRPHGEPYEIEVKKIEGWNEYRTTGQIAGYYYKDRILTSNRINLKFEIRSEEKDGKIKINNTIVRSD